MSKDLPVGLKSQLETVLGDRVRFNQVERLVYSHDMGVLPSQVMKLIDNMPDAVTQPVSEEEVANIAQLANQYQWPLITRGYSLRLYPSSAPSATVAGWVAQGGSGFGSYEYGFCGENIISVDLILPDGSTQTFNDEKIRFVYGLCGITGMISKVTLKIKKYEEEIPVLITFENLRDATTALKSIKEQQIPLWSVSMSTPDYIKLKQEVSKHQVLAEDKYYLTLVYIQGIDDAIITYLRQILSLNRGQIIPRNQAQEEWDERFFPMRFKKLGPTLIASEVIVPVDKLVEYWSKPNQGECSGNWELGTGNWELGTGNWELLGSAGRRKV